MDEDAQQFMVKRGGNHLRVAPHGVKRDEDVAIETLGGGVVEGDDIGVVVVLQELAVDRKNLLVVSEQVVDITHTIAVLCRYSTNPTRHMSWV